MNFTYNNRELSWIKFNHRVLMESTNESFKVLDRLKFVAISASNLDEFFMVRFASLNDQKTANLFKKDISGLSPEEQINEIIPEIKNYYADVKDILEDFHNKLLPNISVSKVQYADLSKKNKDKLEDFFLNSIFPVLTPMAIDISRPFPLVLNKSLNIVIELESNDLLRFATVQIPSNISRVIPVTEGDNFSYILLEDLVINNLDKLFIGQNILETSVYRITRNAELDLLEDEAEDLLADIESSIKKRKWGEPIRLEVPNDISDTLLEFLEKMIDIDKNYIFKLKFDIDPTYYFSICAMKSISEHSTPTYTPKNLLSSDTEDIFDLISRKDIFLHHPYDSFYPVIDLIEKASNDPNVLAIKQTLYRVSGNSPIIKALKNASEKGKQVTVLVELKARFDEENNILWAKELEKNGCHVIYSLPGYKTHSKITLIIRKESDKIRRYVHLSTGNYNDQTAKLYTDMGMFTSSPEIGSDASLFFNMISGYSDISKTSKLVISPYALRDKIIDLIEREIAHSKKGNKGLIIIKVNSLVDKEIIEKLYNASREGVRIKLIIRGICCLVPGVKKQSENIEVISIIGKFLEHSRIFYFYNNNQETVYLSSADLMPRNLNRRFEIMFPIRSQEIKERIFNTLSLYLTDSKQSYLLSSDGYEKISKGTVSSQDILSSLRYSNSAQFNKKIQKYLES
jgi:polyphosphate kinase